jgi:hypothetical protein
VSKYENQPMREQATDNDREETYERPEIIDYGALTELTLSGNNSLSDGFMTGGS